MSKVEDVLRTLHTEPPGGHKGPISTLKKLLQNFWLPRPLEAIRKFVGKRLPHAQKLHLTSQLNMCKET